jgi:hypothetical protein
MPRATRARMAGSLAEGHSAMSVLAVVHLMRYHLMHEDNPRHRRRRAGRGQGAGKIPQLDGGGGHFGAGPEGPDHAFGTFQFRRARRRHPQKRVVRVAEPRRAACDERAGTAPAR